MSNSKMPEEIQTKGKKAQKAAKVLAGCTAEIKNAALHAMAGALIENSSDILNANRVDVDQCISRKMNDAFIDRIMLDEERIIDMANGLRQVASLPDPVGEITGGWVCKNGLKIEKIRVPLGVIGIIYEARPNVTADAAGLCLKSGNAVILRGGKETLRSNSVLVDLMSSAISNAGIPPDAIQLIENIDRSIARAMMQANGLIDVLIPRGGGSLIQTVVQNATVPVIETGVGNCHLYIDASADQRMAREICINAKTQRPSVCNAIETLIIHKDVDASFLNDLLNALADEGVEIRGCGRTCELYAKAKPAVSSDWDEEFLRLVIAVKVVESIDEALEHIHNHSSKHSEAIVTADHYNAERFVNEVDAATVYINASTRFTDGMEFGFGAEIGISTQKLHARGPMGLPELTSTKYILRGNGHIR